MSKVEVYFPQELIYAHNFAFQLHDILVELLRSGEEQRIFNTTIRYEGGRKTRHFKRFLQMARPFL